MFTGVIGDACWCAGGGLCERIFANPPPMSPCCVSSVQGKSNFELEKFEIVFHIFSNVCRVKKSESINK